jgi:hypothetical protein
VKLSHLYKIRDYLANHSINRAGIIALLYHHPTGLPLLHLAAHLLEDEDTTYRAMIRLTQDGHVQSQWGSNHYTLTPDTQQALAPLLGPPKQPG